MYIQTLNLDPEILADIEAYAIDWKVAKDIFSSKWYHRFMHLDPSVLYTKEGQKKINLYGGGLGLGNYVQIYYDVDTGYSFDAINDMYAPRNVIQTRSWPALKEAVDAFFAPYAKQS